jgi:hypothetical protein
MRLHTYHKQRCFCHHQQRYPCRTTDTQLGCRATKQLLCSSSCGGGGQCTTCRSVGIRQRLLHLLLHYQHCAALGCYICASNCHMAFEHSVHMRFFCCCSSDHCAVGRSPCCYSHAGLLRTAFTCAYVAVPVHIPALSAAQTPNPLLLLTCRDPPHSSSSPLALFYTSAPVALHTPASAATAAAATARRAAAPTTTGSSSSSRAVRPPASGTSASADPLAAACCDVRVLERIQPGCYMHVDGDLLSYSFFTGYK